MITHIDVNTYYRCPMLLYLEKHGPRSERHVHPLIAFYRKKKKRKEYTKQELDLHVSQTFNECSIGKEKLNNVWVNANSYYARFDILIKKGGESLFGDYYYIPVFPSTSHSMKRAKLMERAFKILVLSRFQAKELRSFILKEKDKEVEYQLDEDLFLMLERDLLEIENIVANKKTIFPSIAQSCKICPWLQYCRKIALELNDLSLVSGIGKKVKEELKSQGINNLYQLAQANLQSLKLDTVSINDLEYFKLQAQSLISNEPIIREHLSLPEADVEFFVDIEASAYHSIVWLIGCLVRENGNIEYIPFIAHKKGEEKKMVKELIQLIKSKKKSYVIYHWSSTEKNYFSKLRNKFPSLKDDINKILPHFYDLFTVFKKKIVLPVFSYTVKEVAKFLGFNWHEPYIDGATSITLFEQWKRTKDYNLLKRAISYNSDDCKALMIIKDYITKLEKR